MVEILILRLLQSLKMFIINLVEMYYMAIVGSGVSDLLNLMFVVEVDGEKKINADFLNLYLKMALKYDLISKDKIVGCM